MTFLHLALQIGFVLGTAGCLLFPSHPGVKAYAGDIPLRLTNDSQAPAGNVDLISIPRGDTEWLICTPSRSGNLFLRGCTSDFLEPGKSLTFFIKPGRYAIFDRGHGPLRREFEVHGPVEVVIVSYDARVPARSKLSGYQLVAVQRLPPSEGSGCIEAGHGGAGGGYPGNPWCCGTISWEADHNTFACH